jgi:hypothetical protein
MAHNAVDLLSCEQLYPYVGLHNLPQLARLFIGELPASREELRLGHWNAMVI